MKTFFLTAIAFICFYPAHSQNWNYIKDYEGISSFWLYRKEGEKYITELKFTNNNAYSVKIYFTPTFICSDNTQITSAEHSIIIEPFKSVAGQWHGLWFYPCEGSRPPKSGGYTNLIVKSKF